MFKFTFASLHVSFLVDNCSLGYQCLYFSVVLLIAVSTLHVCVKVVLFSFDDHFVNK